MRGLWGIILGAGIAGASPLAAQSDGPLVRMQDLLGNANSKFVVIDNLPNLTSVYERGEEDVQRIYCRDGQSQDTYPSIVIDFKRNLLYVNNIYDSVPDEVSSFKHQDYHLKGPQNAIVRMIEYPNARIRKIASEMLRCERKKPQYHGALE